MQIKLDDVQPHHFATFRDKRLQDGNRACQYDLVLLRAAWNTARIEWGWDLGDNPLTLIRFPKSNPPRERRLKQGEYEKLRAACTDTKVFGEAKEFGIDVDKYIDWVKSSPPATGFDAVLMPGDPERLCTMDRLKNGIPLDAGTIEQLIATAKSVKVSEEIITMLSSDN